MVRSRYIQRNKVPAVRESDVHRWLRKAYRMLDGSRRLAFRQGLAAAEMGQSSFFFGKERSKKNGNAEASFRTPYQWKNNETPREWDRWIRGYQDCLAVADGCWFDWEEAELVADFMRSFLRHSKGEWAGAPFELIPWQRDELVMPLFGWKRPDGTRRYRQVYVQIPKKNGKSTICAGFSIILGVYDQEPGVEVYNAATARDQARIAWVESSRMVKASPELSEILTVHDHVSTIHYPDLMGFIKALSAEHRQQEGLNIYGLIRDEVHAWTDRRFWDTLYYGGASRAQPLYVSITTAGDDPASVCYEEYEHAHKVTAGTVDDWEFLPLVYEAPREGDPMDPDVWAIANPSLDVTISREEMATAAKRAKEQPSSMAAFKRYRLNIWVQAHNPWIDLWRWDRCADERTTLDAVIGG